MRIVYKCYIICNENNQTIIRDEYNDVIHYWNHIVSIEEAKQYIDEYFKC